MEALYQYYKGENMLPKFMEILSYESINNLYQKFKDDLNEFD